MSPAPSGPAVPFELGDFVRCNFPYSEAPDRPGPEEHLGLCLGTLEAAHGRVAIVAAYTTSQPWPADVPLPPGMHRISQAQATAMGQQKAFIIDGRKIAFMPLDRRFFPMLDEPGHGKVGASVALANRVIADGRTLMQRSPDLIVRLGPLRPR